MPVMLAQMAGSLSDVSLYDLIFKTVLQMPQCAGGATWGCVNGIFSHDFIFGLLLPHIVLIIFIFGAAEFGPHKGLSTLLGMGIYIFIVYSGWYALFASLTLFWLALSLILSTFFFISGRIISPAKAESLAMIARKGKQKRMLKEEIRRIENQLRRPNLSPDEKAKLQEALANAQKDLRTIS